VRSAVPKSRRNKAFEVRALSDAEVARYLRHLVTMHKDKRTGNPLLATALSRLADRLEQGNIPVPSAREEQSPLPLGDLEKFDSDAITQFLDDDSKPKAALVELAASRFGIPRSKLYRMKISEVRDTINSALQHENSLKIIGQEAERQGTYRKS